jgi:formylglycine-generating enzyme required for sulfatase activity
MLLEIKSITTIILLVLVSPIEAIDVMDQKKINFDTHENMVFVKGGCFQMGQIFEDLPKSDEFVHEVCVDDIYIGKYEVTLGEFRRFANETGYKTEAEWQDGCHGWEGKREKKKETFNWRNPGFSQSEKDPVVCVSWNDANEYIKWLNNKNGKNYRLPTEAEWEYAARSGGKKYKYSWGNGEPSGNIADKTSMKKLLKKSDWKGYDDQYAFTSPVGSFKPNELGLYDMSGNVYEWILDWVPRDYYRKSSKTKNNPKGLEHGTVKGLRGGSWNPLPAIVRTTYCAFLRYLRILRAVFLSVDLPVKIDSK